MKVPVSVAVNVELLLAPVLKTSATCCAVTPPEPTNGVVAHCIATDWNTGGPSFWLGTSAVRMLVPLRRRQAIGLVITPLTSVASDLPRNSIAALFPDAG